MTSGSGINASSSSEIGRSVSGLTDIAVVVVAGTVVVVELVVGVAIVVVGAAVVVIAGGVVVLSNGGADAGEHAVATERTARSAEGTDRRS